eukprot:scaffold9267_cov112-Isochrysis_galbana.AAC.8
MSHTPRARPPPVPPAARVIRLELGGGVTVPPTHGQATLPAHCRARLVQVIASRVVRRGRWGLLGWEEEADSVPAVAAPRTCAACAVATPRRAYRHA